MGFFVNIFKPGSLPLYFKFYIFFTSQVSITRNSHGLSHLINMSECLMRMIICPIVFYKL